MNILRKDENVYLDEEAGCWIAELENPEGSCKRWSLLGCFNTRRDAIEALVLSRGRR